MSFHQLLIVHPVPSTRSLMTSMLRTMGHKIEEALGEESALAQMGKSRADLLLVSSDVADGLDPLHLLAQVRGKYPKVPVLMFTSEPRPERAREVMLRGATSVLRFPMPANQLRAVVSQALEDVVPACRIREKEAKTCANGASGHGPGVPGGGPGGPGPGRPAPSVSVEAVIGEDPALRMAVELADAVAPTRAPVMVLGERGTGKSLLARRLHDLGPRSGGPFLEVGCGASPDGSLAADLFGEGDRAGLVVEARGGTLVLNDVGELAHDLQMGLLELVKEGTFQPVGGEGKQASDCRVVVTSREDLAALVKNGSFRSDLHQALSLVSLSLPALRQRRDDVIPLTEFFLERFIRQHARASRGLGPEAVAYLRDHAWTGNVCELRDAVERAVLVSRDSWIMPSHLALSPSSPPPSHGPDGAEAELRRHRSRPADGRRIRPLKEALEEPERQLILAALQSLNWNRQETARVLDINRTTLYKKMKKYGLLFDEPVWVN